MQRALHIRTTVLPGGKIEIVDQGLPVGESVDVVVSQSPASERRSVVDILDEAPGHLAFKTAADVAAYLSEEKEAWGRRHDSPPGSIFPPSAVVTIDAKEFPNSF